MSCAIHVACLCSKSTVILSFIFFSYDMESATLKPPDDIVEAAKKWLVNSCPDERLSSLLPVCRETELASAQHEVKDIQDSLEDTGVTRLVPVPFSPSSLEAEPEKDDVMKKPKSSHLMQEDSTHQLQVSSL